MTAVETAQAKGWRAIYFSRGTIPYWGIHITAIVGVAIVGFSWSGLALALACYVPRLFFVTAAYHRYFSHRTFKTSRWFQFVLGLGATLTAQKGPLWWAAHHRLHHKLSDQPGDLHSVAQSGFLWAHQGWIVSPGFNQTDYSRVKDLAKYPELMWLNRYWMLPVVALGAATYFLGGFEVFVWAFAVSMVLSFHGTFTINSLSHVWGSQRYRTTDDSRNNLALALITLGEGWHNNHHYYQSSARQGFYWWEIDITYYVLRGLAAVGLIWELRGVPDHIRDAVHELDAVTAGPVIVETADVA